MPISTTTRDNWNCTIRNRLRVFPHPLPSPNGRGEFALTPNPSPRGRGEQALTPGPSPRGRGEQALTPGPSPKGRGEQNSLSLRERVRVRDNGRGILPRWLGKGSLDLDKEAFDAITP